MHVVLIDISLPLFPFPYLLPPLFQTTTSEIVHLQAYDLKRIQEVNNAMSVFKDEKILQMMGNATQCDYDETVSIAESFVAKILVFSKSFAAFTSLAYPDQITVLKSFYPEIASICTSFLYNTQRSPLAVDQVSFILRLLNQKRFWN